MTPKNKNISDEPHSRAVERRTVLEWFGKAAVLSLGSPLLAACDSDTTDPFSPGDTAFPGDTASETDSSLATDSESDSDPYPFSPGEGHPLLDEFVVFTVDELNLADILKSWTLRIDGLVETPVTLTFNDLRNLTTRKQETDFHCVTGWSVYDVPWVGVHISTLLQLAKPLGAATHITFHCQGDVYSESTTIEEALEPKTMMAYGVGETTLPLDHGFPLRLIFPRKYGYKNAKYVYRIELTDAPYLGYWEQRGYAYEADVMASRLREGKY